MTRSWSRSGAGRVGLAVLAMGCGDDPAGPSGDPTDIELANEEAAVLRAELIANTDLAADVARVTAAVDTLGPPLPSELAGTTLEWDEAASGYVATAATGAPADALRFIVYDRTASPFVPVGHVDLRDESDASRAALDVRFEKEGLVRLGHLIELDAPGPGDVAASGFVTGGTRRVNFDVSQTTVVVGDGFRIDLDYSLSLADRPLALLLDYALNLSVLGSSARFLSTVDIDDDRLVIDFGQASNGTIDGEVLWNDQLLMTVTDDGNGQPRFLGPAGDPLSAAEDRAIQGIVDFALEGLGYLLPYLVVPEDPDDSASAGSANQSSRISSNSAITLASSRWPSQK